MPSFTGATTWLNSEPLTPEGLRGKVVVADFCTYTCINWLRSLPYVRAWDERYRGDGLVTIGIHTPEFSFERSLDNIRPALEQMRVTYPVAVDNDYAVWNAFSNHYWPALYFVDARGTHPAPSLRRGRLRALGDRNRTAAGRRRRGCLCGRTRFRGSSGPEVAADWGALNTPETYLGYRQTENFSSPGGLEPDAQKIYEVPGRVRHNHWALSGDWTAMAEATVLNEPKGRVAFRFDARDVHLVMGPAAGTSVPFYVSIDGAPPGASAGTDVDPDGSGELIEPRMYQLIRQRGAITDRLFEIEFLDAGAAVYAFTFG